LVLLTASLNRQIGRLPPLGKFLDPFHGFWRNVELSDRVFDNQMRLHGLERPVSLSYDDRQVPHIFAEREHDLYFMQGFVTAKDRLWQMEFQTHAAAGRLAEILGPALLQYDRHQRRIGMTYAAEKTLRALQHDAEMVSVLQAYSDGVNEFISTLAPAEFPLEYKILDYAPEPWTPLKCVYLLKYMAWKLTGRSNDLRMTNVLSRFGPEIVRRLFPDTPVRTEPVIPPGTVWHFQPVTRQRPETAFEPAVARDLPKFQPHPGNGSNNWAVSGSRTASGYPLLANDPHLDLTLPSIWYEIQLAGPDVNVYGVSLPGAPSIIVGFNQKIGWGVTNSEADVLDWYQETFRDASRKEYWHDNQWKKTWRRVEKIRIRGAATVLDTVMYTHHGPIVLEEGEDAHDGRTPPGHAMRWLGHDPGNEVRTFYELNRAANYEEYVRALESYVCPAQNFVFASQDNDIALWHNGRFPARWREQGKFILDGSDPLTDWQGWIPHEQNPHVKNPKRGFVSSANQKPTDLKYPYYLGAHFAPYYRGARINEWLRTSDNLVPDDFRVIQLDTKNLHAESVLPALLKMLARPPLSEKQKDIFEVLRRWDFFNDAEKVAPTVFDKWWRILYHAIWDDEFGEPGLTLPGRARTVEMIVGDPDAGWFDDIHTGKVETLPELVRAAFDKACGELRSFLGDMGEAWQWGKYKATSIRHLARIPGLGIKGLITGGDLGIVNATGRHHGPSWRMVVSLGPEVEAWGIYPGGQSGNPGSRHYRDFVDDWLRGELAELLFMKTKDDDHGRILNNTGIDPK